MRDIFKAIDEIASGSLKTPSEVVLFQNYNYMNRIIKKKIFKQNVKNILKKTLCVA